MSLIDCLRFIGIRGQQNIVRRGRHLTPAMERYCATLVVMEANEDGAKTTTTVGDLILSIWRYSPRAKEYAEKLMEDGLYFGPRHVCYLKGGKYDRDGGWLTQARIESRAKDERLFRALGLPMPY